MTDQSKVKKKGNYAWSLILGLLICIVDIILWSTGTSEFQSSYANKIYGGTISFLATAFVMLDLMDLSKGERNIRISGVELVVGICLSIVFISAAGFKPEMFGFLFTKVVSVVFFVGSQIVYLIIFGLFAFKILTRTIEVDDSEER